MMHGCFDGLQGKRREVSGLCGLSPAKFDFFCTGTAVRSYRTSPKARWRMEHLQSFARN